MKYRYRVQNIHGSPGAVVSRQIALGVAKLPTARPQAQNWSVVKALLGLRWVPVTDAADALAVAICHARQSTVLGKEMRPKGHLVRG